MKGRYIEFQQDSKTYRARVIQTLFGGSTLEIGWLDRSGRTTILASDARTISKTAAMADPHFTTEMIGDRIMRDHADIIRGAEYDEFGQPCYLVAYVRRERGDFSVTGELYASRRAFDLGSTEAVIAGGCMHDAIGATFPELRPIIALHLVDSETGEPMHAVANGWYHLSGTSQRAEHKSTRKDRTHYVSAACRALRCTTADLADGRVQDALSETDPELARDTFDAWADEVLRPRWQKEADAANEWIDAHRGGIEVPAEVNDEDDYHVDLGDPDDDHSLRIHARQTSESWDNIGGHYLYEVSVSDGDYTYETTFTGSTADYDEGRICAREAAFCVLRELVDFGRYDSAVEYADELGIEYHEIENWTQWEATHQAARALADAIEPHAELVGG